METRWPPATPFAPPQILEPRFSSETLALLLNIPPQKTLLRRHLATAFSALVGGQAAQEKREYANASGHVPLTTTAKVKVKPPPEAAGLWLLSRVTFECLSLPAKEAGLHSAQPPQEEETGGFSGLHLPHGHWRCGGERRLSNALRSPQRPQPPQAGGPAGGRGGDRSSNRLQTVKQPCLAGRPVTVKGS